MEETNYGSLEDTFKYTYQSCITDLQDVSKRILNSFQEKSFTAMDLLFNIDSANHRIAVSIEKLNEIDAGKYERIKTNYMTILFKIAHKLNFVYDSSKPEHQQKIKDIFIWISSKIFEYNLIVPEQISIVINNIILEEKKKVRQIFITSTGEVFKTHVRIFREGKDGAKNNVLGLVCSLDSGNITYIKTQNETNIIFVDEITNQMLSESISIPMGFIKDSILDKLYNDTQTALDVNYTIYDKIDDGIGKVES